MLEAVSESRPDYSIAAVNRARFVDKSQALRPHFPPDTLFTFVLGYDTLVRLFDPRYYSDMPKELDRLFDVSCVVAINRTDNTLEDVHRFLRRPECAAYLGRIKAMGLDPAFSSVSSTQVRERLRRGEPVSQLVPEPVERVIQRAGLYRGA